MVGLGPSGLGSLHGCLDGGYQGKGETVIVKGELSRNATAGYRYLMWLVRGDDIKYDPWGTATHWLSTIAGVVYVTQGEALPGYGPSPLVRPGENGRYWLTANDGEEVELLRLFDDGAVTADDMRAVYTVLYRLADWAELAGRSY